MPGFKTVLAIGFCVAATIVAAKGAQFYDALQPTFTVEMRHVASLHLGTQHLHPGTFFSTMFGGADYAYTKLGDSRTVLVLEHLPDGTWREWRIRPTDPDRRPMPTVIKRNGILIAVYGQNCGLPLTIKPREASAGYRTHNTIRCSYGVYAHLPDYQTDDPCLSKRSQCETPERLIYQIRLSPEHLIESDDEVSVTFRKVENHWQPIKPERLDQFSNLMTLKLSRDICTDRHSTRAFQVRTHNKTLLGLEAVPFQMSVPHGYPPGETLCVWGDDGRHIVIDRASYSNRTVMAVPD